MTTPDRFDRMRALEVVARLGITRAEAAALLLLALAACGGLGLLWWVQTPSPAVPAPISDGAPLAGDTPGGPAISSAEVVVHVAGLVAEPGLHRLPGGARVADALAAAGGPLPDAWLDGLNLARPLQDGEQLLVPAEPQPGAAPAAGEAGSAQAGGGAGVGGVRPDGTVDLNRASLEELQTLPGVGPVMSQRILDHREQHGPFTSVGQLRDIPGIGERTFQNLADLVGV